jgi:signal transduction histidine kinase
MFGDVRSVSRTLYPPTLEPFGLCTALKQLGSDLQSRRTAVRVRCGPSLAETRFQLETEIELFRIAQEAVSNALRHGKPGRIDLSLGYAKGLLRLTVADDGKGFDTKKAFRRGLGLISMRERAEEIGGTLRITSSPGRTCVEVQAHAQKRS